MRNLGSAVEKDLNAAGIFYASEVKKLGAKKTFIKMLEGKLKLGRSAGCCNALFFIRLWCDPKSRLEKYSSHKEKEV